MTVVLGAVAYDPKVVLIWSGFRRWLGRRGVDLDFVLYSHYERQTEDLVDGRLDLAWQSPLAWLRGMRLAAARGSGLRPLLMRDTDRDLSSVVVVRADSGFHTVADLKGEVVATGAVDSPQATLLPLAHLADLGLRPGEDFTVRRFDLAVGLHGDHVGGEREAARAMLAGEVAAACLLDATSLALASEGTLPPGSARLLTRTAPYDHCVLAAGPTAPAEATDRLVEQLLAMSYADPEARPLLDLEGLTAWLPGRTTGFGHLDAAVDLLGFYDRAGRVTAAGYSP
ncbi:MAG TPA: phosphate/phosphite/phosphonate ABC transporter substrate-binding protein [Mycobacteriales bacterium]